SLTRSELRSWLMLMSGIQSLLDALDRQLRDEAGISHDDYRILSSLYRSPGRSRRMKDLAQEMSYSPSRLTHAASRLESQAWVTRLPSAVDHRGVDIELTEAGVAKARDASRRHLALVKEVVFDALDPDLLRAAVQALHQIGTTSDASR
ncbi:MAG: MarR family transcriptional regulator, partial [Acidimicrobiia bacterium]